MIDVPSWRVVASVIGLGLAVSVLLSVVRDVARRRGLWVQVGTAGVSIALLPPVMFVLLAQTRDFRAKGLTEVGSAAFKDPPMTEDAAHAIRRALHPGESWATVTQYGRCGDVDLYAFYWLAFRLVPNPPDCTNPDFELFLRIDPPTDAVIVDRGRDYALVRR